MYFAELPYQRIKSRLLYSCDGKIHLKKKIVLGVTNLPFLPGKQLDQRQNKVDLISRSESNTVFW